MATKQYLAPDATGVPKATTPAVASAADSLVATDATGHLDPSVMPVGIAPPTATVVTSEALAAGDFVNIYNNAGTANVRKADASVAGKEAHGFVLAVAAFPGSALVYFPGDENTQVTALTPGDQFLSDVTPGKCSTTVPSTAGHLVQFIGTATAATNVVFEPSIRYTN